MRRLRTIGLIFCWYQVAAVGGLMPLMSGSFSVKSVENPSCFWRVARSAMGEDVQSRHRCIPMKLRPPLPLVDGGAKVS